MTHSSALPQISRAEAAAKFGITTLTQLTDAHLDTEQKAKFQRLLQRARQWRVGDARAFVLVSQTRGIGKSHIAKAVFDSFGKVTGSDVTGWTGFQNNGRFFDAATLMAQLGENREALQLVIPRDCPIVVIDDLGREGHLKYVDAAGQLPEIRSRYFRVIDWCYSNEIRLFITSNMPRRDLAAGTSVLESAAWSRLLHMAGRDYLIEVTGLPDYRLVAGGFGNA